MAGSRFEGQPPWRRSYETDRKSTISPRGSLPATARTTAKNSSAVR